MNIFMVTKPVSPFLDEGSKNLTFNLCKHIKKHRFHLMTCKGVELPLIENLIYHPLYPNSYISNVPRASLFNKIKLFCKILNQKDIDIYHFIFRPNLSSSLVAKMFFKMSKKKSVQTISTPLTESQLKKCLFADRIVVLSEWTKNRVLKLGYNNVTKIKPGIDLDKFSKDKLRNIRKELGLGKKDFIILFASEYDIKRGTRVVLEILEPLIKAHPEAKIVFACRVRSDKDIEEKNFLAESVNKIGLNDHVLFLDCIRYMPELINSCDINIFPALSCFTKMEIPMLLLESLALEKPVIISDVQPFDEVLQKNLGGLKIKPGDSKDLLDNIVKLIKNKKLKNRLGKEGRLLVEKEFDIKKVAKEYEKLYEELK